MDYDRFIGLVQNRARLSTNGDAVGAIRATLTTLAERIDAGEADDLAAQLPREIGYYLRAECPPGGERFSFGEFCERVAEREWCDLPEAVYHARCVIEVLSEAVAAGEIRDLREQLPESFQPLFEAGSRGRMRQRESGSRRSRTASDERAGGERPRGEPERWTDDERFSRPSAGGNRGFEEARERDQRERSERGREEDLHGRDTMTESRASRSGNRSRPERSREERARREPLEYQRP